jgi:hypothetical protein
VSGSHEVPSGLGLAPFKKIIHCHFAVCGMQPRKLSGLTQHTGVIRKILRGAIHAGYGTRKIFLVYGSFTADPGGKPLTSM